MSLKSSVQRLRNQEADQAAIKRDRDGFITQWKEDVGSVYDQFEEALKPFVDDGAAQLSRGETTISEDALGEYLIEFLIIKILGRRIILAPQARVIVGGTGRLDLYKESRPSEDNRLLVMRGTENVGYNPNLWLIQDRPKPRSAMEAALGAPALMFENLKRQFSFLDSNSIQEGVDYVLNR